MFTFPRETTKKTAVSQAVHIHHIHLVLYMAVSTCLTSISRKVPPSEPPAAVTGISLLSAYLFAMMYASAPEKFLHPSDNSSPVSSFKRITVACQSGILTPLPLVTLVAACRRFDNLFIKAHFPEQIRHLCYGNACVAFIPFWFVFLSKKEKIDVDFMYFI